MSCWSAGFICAYWLFKNQITFLYYYWHLLKIPQWACICDFVQWYSIFLLIKHIPSEAFTTFSPQLIVMHWHIYAGLILQFECLINKLITWALCSVPTGCILASLSLLECITRKMPEDLYMGITYSAMTNNIILLYLCLMQILCFLVHCSCLW